MEAILVKYECLFDTVHPVLLNVSPAHTKIYRIGTHQVGVPFLGIPPTFLRDKGFHHRLAHQVRRQKTLREDEVVKSLLIEL